MRGWDPVAADRSRALGCGKTEFGSEARLTARLLASLAAAALLLAGGCATYSESSSAHVTALRSGDTDALAASLEAKRDSGDKQLHLVEAARMRMLACQFGQSAADFALAIDEVAELEDGAVIKLRSVGSSALASTVATDTAMDYHLPPYELVMALQEQALNHLFMGDFETAGVFVRRAVYAQDQIARENERKIEAARQELASKNFSDGYEKIEARYAAMAPVLGRAKSSFQNAYAWYLSGLFFEAFGEPGNAYVSYKKAWELSPDNRAVRRSVARMARSEHPQEFREFSEIFEPADCAGPNHKSRLVILLEEGLISRRQSVKQIVPLPGLGTLQPIVFPVYSDPPYQPRTIQVRIDGEISGQASLLTSVQALAYHDLKERLPGIALRNMSRALTRGIAQQRMMRRDNKYVKLAGLLWNVQSLVADQADTRAWYSLPMAVQLYETYAPPGLRRIEIVNPALGRSIEAEVRLRPGSTKLMWVADIGGRAVVCVSDLSDDTGPAWYAQYGSITSQEQTLLAGSALRITPTPTISTAGAIAAGPPAEPRVDLAGGNEAGTQPEYSPASLDPGVAVAVSQAPNERTAAREEATPPPGAMERDTAPARRARPKVIIF